MKNIAILAGIVIVSGAAVLGIMERDNIRDIFSEDILLNPEMIQVASPKINGIVSSPLEVTGKARGNWFFEASFPVKLLDANNNVLTVAIAQAQSDWMTENFVPFKAVVEFNRPTTQTGTLVFQKDNPSGLPEHDDEIRIPVKFDLTGEIMTVKVYFNNNNLDPEFSCNEVFPVEREVPKTQAVARAALEELLKGVRLEEQNQGFFTSINPNVKIQSLVIENNTAKVDFDDQLEFQVGGSCRVSAISAQIRETLKQFSTVKEVVISINGRTEDILQP